MPNCSACRDEQAAPEAGCSTEGALAALQREPWLPIRTTTTQASSSSTEEEPLLEEATQVQEALLGPARGQR